MSRTFAIFYSPTVKASAKLSLLQAACKEVGLQVEYYPVQDCQKLAPTLKADVLVAAGGDGTVNCVANEALKLKKPLGVVPLGTLNHLAKDLSLPLVPLQAVQALEAGTLLKIDVGQVNDHVFLNNCSIGLYPSFVRARERLQPYLGKWPAAVAATYVVVRQRLQLQRLQMKLDGEAITKKSSLLFVGNNVYGLEGVGLPTRDTLLDGKLNIFILKTKRIDRLMRVIAYSLLGKTLPEKYMERYDATRLDVAISARKQAWVGYDGEIAQMQLPLNFKSLPKALTVITPTDPNS